jgi:nitrogenase subunit NifH
VTAELARHLGDKLFRTVIPRNIRLAEAPSHGKPALLYDVRSRGAESYIQLAKEILERHRPVAQGPQDAVEEKKVVNAPRWQRWINERNKLITINLTDR